MSESQNTVLSELCTICHVNPRKYKCPRCAITTCSVECSRRHKTWSECSGVRDPAAYAKRKELATPVAFDRDFNFLTAIERTFEKADRVADNRGITRALSGPTPRQKNQTLLTKLEDALKGNETRIVKAPIALSRSMTNRTHWNKSLECINWTIEWVSSGNRKAISRCLETLPLQTAFSRTALSRDRPMKRKVAGAAEELTKKQKTETTETATGEVKGSSQLEVPEETTTPSAGSAEGPSVPADSRPGSETTMVVESSSPKSPDETRLHFYLQCVQVSSRLPVLIPLSQPEHTTIHKALHGRVLLEYPTFYVLPWAPSELPRDEYVLEETYLRVQSTSETQRNSDEENQKLSS